MEEIVPPPRKVSEKQYAHLQKAREAKKRKHEDSIKSDLESIKEYVISLQNDIAKLTKPEEPSAKKTKTIHDFFYDPVTVACVFTLTLATLGTIYVSKNSESENNMYSYL